MEKQCKCGRFYYGTRDICSVCRMKELQNDIPETPVAPTADTYTLFTCPHCGKHIKAVRKETS